MKWLTTLLKNPYKWNLEKKKNQLIRGKTEVLILETNSRPPPFLTSVAFYKEVKQPSLLVKSSGVVFDFSLFLCKLNFRVFVLISLFLVYLVLFNT